MLDDGDAAASKAATDSLGQQSIARDMMNLWVSKPHAAAGDGTEQGDQKAMMVCAYLIIIAECPPGAYMSVAGGLRFAVALADAHHCKR